MFLIHTEDDGFAETVGLFEEVGEVAGDGLGSGLQGNNPFKVPGMIFVIRNGAAVTIQLAKFGPPTGGVHGGNDPVHPVRGQETVLDALAETVSVDGIAEILIGIDVVMAQGRGGHTQLRGRLKIFEDLPPIAIVAGTAPVAFIDDDQVEEVGGIFPV